MINLYELHRDKEKLDKSDVYRQQIKDAINCYFENVGDVRHIIRKDPQIAYWYVTFKKLKLKDLEQK